jgi:ribonucleotide reductase beta subunit family protein with ferritin-like domain
LSQDLNDWNNKLNDDEDISWNTFLLFFAASDGM